MSGTSKGQQGTATGSVEVSPERRRRHAVRRKREEARWAAKAGPVTVTRTDASPEAEASGPEDDQRP